MNTPNDASDTQINKLFDHDTKNAYQRAVLGYLPKAVTLRVQGDIKLVDLEAALAGKFEVYKDATEALCLRTVEAGNAHRELVRQEREARLLHAQRHAAIVKAEGQRNVENGYMAESAK